MDRPESGRAAFWANPDFDLGDYDKILVPEVELWDLGSGTGQTPDAMASEDSVKLAALFRQKTVEKLEAEGWTIADVAGPRVARIRLALTELNGANRFGNVLTSIPYVSTQAIRLASAATDVHVFVGKASAELQILDSASGVLLAEAYDRRVGTHGLSNIGSTWGDVEDAIGVFADRIAEGLSKLPK